MTIEAYAKVNFTLEVLGVRSDGYHALRSVVVPVSLSDTLEIAEAESLSTDTGYADDLILKAARALDASAPGARPRGASFRVAKRIPAGGGLGGGSADAAAALIALNAMWDLGCTRERLAEIGALVGSDVPALVLAHPPCAADRVPARGGAVLMEGRGEKVSPLFPAAGALAAYDLVLANPGVHASTPGVFGRCPSRPADAPSALDAMVAALRTGEVGRIASALANDMEGAALALYPAIGRAFAALESAGLRSPRMSGSGATAYALAQSRAAAELAADALAAEGFAAWPAVAWV